MFNYNDLKNLYNYLNNIHNLDLINDDTYDATCAFFDDIKDNVVSNLVKDSKCDLFLTDVYNHFKQSDNYISHDEGHGIYVDNDVALANILEYSYDLLNVFAYDCDYCFICEEEEIEYEFSFTIEFDWS